MRKRILITKITEYTGHKGSVFAMAMDEAQYYAYTSGDDGVVAAWDLQEPTDDGKAIIKLQESVYALCYINEGKLLLVGTSIGNVYIVDLQKKKILFTYRLNQRAIYHIAYQASSQSICILHAQGLLTVMNLSDFGQQYVLKLANNHLRAVLLDTHPEHIWIGSSDQQIIKLDIKSGKVVEKWPAHTNSVFALALHKEGKYLISGGRDAYLRVWDIQNKYQEIRSIPAHNFTINDISFSPSGDHFVTASRDKTLKIWDAYTFELLKVIDYRRNESHTHSVNRIRWLNDGSIISSGDDRKTIRWRFLIE